MIKDEWIPFRYRDFYDVPRAFVVEVNGRHYLFDCPFDDILDDYPSRYGIYLLDPSVAGELDTISWSSLSERGHRIGDISVQEIKFGDSRRRLVNASILNYLGQT